MLRWIVSGLIPALLVLGAHEARASCAIPDPCVCHRGAESAAVIVVVVEASGTTATATVEAIRTNADVSVNLKPGDVVEVDTPEAAAAGERILGLVEVGCESGLGDGCDLADPTREERVLFHRSIAGDGFVSCSEPDPVHRFDAKRAMEALVLENCVDTLRDYVPHNECLSCHLYAAAPGSAESSGAGAVAVLSLAAAARLLRRRSSPAICPPRGAG
jgi:hypothetical protein